MASFSLFRSVRTTLLLALGFAPVGLAAGPDVTVMSLVDINSYGNFGGWIGYSLGTNACNVGDAPVWWCDATRAYCDDDQHPVIAQNLFRLKSGRFEQVGLSWLKHGFLSTNSPSASCGTCVGPPHGGDQLGVGCTDIYSASLNGSRPLGMRSEVDATSGAFPFPYTSVSATGAEQWIRVADADVDPAQNAGAVYWLEAQYVAADDAAAENALNNASYRKVTVSANSSRTLSFSGSTVRELSAVHAWKAEVPQVELATIDFRSDAGARLLERFEVARHATDLGNGTWHYEVAVRNLNSNRAAERLEIDVAGGGTITLAGFRSADHHSGEPYSTTPWSIDTSTPGLIRWESEPFAVNANANALRWGTMFSFWFDADAPPTALRHRLKLFQPGCPASVPFGIPNTVVFADDFECGATGAWSATS